MKRQRRVFAVFSLTVSLMAGESLAWRSTLYPDSWLPPTDGTVNFETDKLIQDFSYAGYRMGDEPVPDVVGPVYDVTLPPYGADAAGTADATTAIQKAINAAQSAGGGVVYLPAGLYRISPQDNNNYALRINASGVVLRGAGVGQTFLLNTSTNMRGKAVIQVEGPSAASLYTGGAGSAALRSDLLGPAQVLPVSSTAGFAVGQWVVVRADCTDAWITEHGETGWLGYGSSLRGPAYFRRVVAVDSAAGTLTVDAPTRYALKTRDNARVVRLSTSPVAEVGLEDFSIGNVQHPGKGWADADYDDDTKAAYDTHGSYLIRATRVRDAWIRRIETFQAAGNTFTCHLLSNGILLNDCSRVTVSEVHMQRSQYGGGGGNGYMYRLQNSCDALVTQCRSTFTRHGFVLSHMGSSGNVFHHCVDSDTGLQTGDTGSQKANGSGSDHHMHFSHSNLIDTSTGDSSWWEARYRASGSEPKHNLTSAHSVFWNIEGTGSGVSYVVRTEQSRYGYAIGTRGNRSGVERPTAGGAKCNPPDHVEGVGQGNTLEPFSLYEDQLVRRLALPEIVFPAEVVVTFPSNSVRLAAEVFAGRKPAAAGTYEIQWRHAAGAGTAVFGDADGTSPLVTFSARGTHEIELTVTTSSGRQVSERVTVTLASDPTYVLVTERLEPVADTYVRDGSYANDNYGTATMLMIKKSSTGYNRRAFLRFDLTSVTQAFVRAYLELQTGSPPSPVTAANAELRLVAADGWNEQAVTWTSQPSLGAVVISWLMSTNLLERLDVTSVALAEHAGDGLLSLALAVTSQPNSEATYSYYSREAAVGRRPRLVLEREVKAAVFDTWIAGQAGVPEGQRGALDDPDGDGLSNMEEYLFGRNPVQAEAGAAWRCAAEPEGFVLEFPQRRGLPPGFGYVIETTASLVEGEWRPAAGVTFQVDDEGGAAVRVRALVPRVGSATQGFYRLRFELGH
ncbi:MAG: DNRLRE domain-containing protein [Kiritimatiellales bacterium]